MAQHLRLTLSGHDCQPFCTKQFLQERRNDTRATRLPSPAYIRRRVVWRKLRLVLYSSCAELCRVNCRSARWRPGRIHDISDSSHINWSSPFCVLVVVVGRDLSCRMYEAVVSSLKRYQEEPAYKTLVTRTSTRWLARTSCSRCVEKRGNG